MPKADLPTAGRAPITARSPGSKQKISRSRSGIPVRIPVISPRDRRSTSSYTPLASSSMRTMRPDGASRPRRAVRSASVQASTSSPSVSLRQKSLAMA